MRQVLIYARLSVTTEESVSIARQLDAGRAYAAARGWEVVGEHVDDGVSASRVKPEDRPGWRAVLSHPGTLDAVIVWKVDRLARRVLDFLHADEALQAKGAGIVAVEDPIDMTTPQGRAFAVLLSVFAELEAATIASRVKAARAALVQAGRRPGGRPPFGFANVPNPDGPGFVLAHDPERIATVSTLAEKALAGHSVHSLARWLEAEGIEPRHRQGRKSAHWHDASVEAILRQPALAGLTPFRGDVVRDAEGLPVVDESVAVISTEERRQILARIEAAKKPGTRQRAGVEPALLYGLARCGSCEGLMYRATAAGKYRQYRCQQPGCPKPVGISRDQLEAYVTRRVLERCGDSPVVLLAETITDDKPRLRDLEAAIKDTAAQMGDDDADMEALGQRLANLKAERARVRTGAPTERRWIRTDRTFTQEWDASEDVEHRRMLLASEVAAVKVMPGGGRGRVFDPGRVELVPANRDADPEGMMAVLGLSREDLT